MAAQTTIQGDHNKEKLKTPSTIPGPKKSGTQREAYAGFQTTEIPRENKPSNYETLFEEFIKENNMSPKFQNRFKVYWKSSKRTKAQL